MPRKSTKTAKVVEKKSTEKKPVEVVTRTETSFLEYLRFGESYTSLILGIIVVIISTALLLSFVHNKNNANKTANEQPTNLAQGVQQNFQITTVPTLSPIVTSTVSTATPMPTATAVPTATPMPTKASAPMKIAQATTMPAQNDQQLNGKAGEYVVKSGDTLWSIAEQQYKSGYNWVDIARANKLTNPGVITTGTKLVLPKVTAKSPTVDTSKSVATADEHNNKTVAKIDGGSYKIVRGDTLYSIAERAYGNGNKWVDIARANKLTNPSVIHADNTLTLPRGK